MARVRLIHQKPAESALLVNSLTAAGHEVEFDPPFESRFLREWRRNPPHVFVVDLSRLPSHGLEIAIALRGSPATRKVPIVFSGGLPEKIEKVRAQLPDAVYCAPEKLPSSIKSALARPPAHPVVPKQMMDRYASRTAAQKLGIAPGSLVLLIDPPPRYPAVLGELPPGVECTEEETAEAPVTLCFVRSPDTLRQTLSGLRRRARHTKLWVLWQKGKSASGGLNETVIRETGLELGLVDYKVCSVNEVWSGLLFAFR